jgi:aryl-alcohol dehydrogenase-like predicted oxidoreductase
MDKERLEVLREAQRIRQRKEDLERAIGRAARKSGHDFQYYVAMVSELRELAASKGVSMDQVAEGLLMEKDGGDDEGRHQDDPGH